MDQRIAIEVKSVNWKLLACTADAATYCIDHALYIDHVTDPIAIDIGSAGQHSNGRIGCLGNILPIDHSVRIGITSAQDLRSPPVSCSSVKFRVSLVATI